MIGLKTFETVINTILIVEIMHMIHKAQVKNYFRDYKSEQDFIDQLFEIDKNNKIIGWKIAA